MKKKVALVCVLCFSVMLLFALSCKGKKQQGAAKGKEEAKKVTVLARLSNGDVITWEELENTYHVERMKSRFNEEQVRRLIENLARQHSIYLDAVAKGYDKDPEYVDQITRMKIQLLNRIAMRKLSEERPEVTETDMRAYYDAHKDAFNVLKTQYLMFALSRYENDGNKAKGDATKALEAIKKGMSFDDAAKKFLNRDRPFNLSLRKGQDSFFGKEFDDVVWNLDKDQITDVIETAQGFIIAQVLDKSFQSFDEARSYIKTTVTREKSTKKTDDYYDSLMKKYNVQFDDPAIRAKLSEILPAAPTQTPASFNPPPPGTPGAPGGIPLPGNRPPMPPPQPPRPAVPPGHPPIPPPAPGQPQ